MAQDESSHGCIGLEWQTGLKEAGRWVSDTESMVRSKAIKGVKGASEIDHEATPAPTIGMLEPSEVEGLVRQVVHEEGLFLYDIEHPGSLSAPLRVYVASAETGPSSVGLDECTRVSRRILDHELVEKILPGDVLLEVSSPGINRSLRTYEHFAGAIGERVRVTVRKAPTSSDSSQSVGSSPFESLGPLGRVLLGTLVEVAKGEIVVEESANQSRIAIPFDRVKEARVDFVFD